jgi:hypothetical protein
MTRKYLLSSGMVNRSTINLANLTLQGRTTIKKHLQKFIHLFFYFLNLNILIIRLKIYQNPKVVEINYKNGCNILHSQKRFLHA